MNDCARIKERLVLHAEGALEPGEALLVVRHLSGCATCRAEADEIGRIRGWLADPALFAPPQDMSWQLFPEKVAQRAAALPTRRRDWYGFLLPKWVGFALPLLPIVIGLVWALTLRAPTPAAPESATPIAAAGNEAFLERMHAAYAQKATSQYLMGCHELLVDLISAEKTCAGERYDVALEVTRARQLLKEKQMLDADLRVPDVARAKTLCDDLENFLVNLSTAQECESGETVRDMERYIENKQLLLRITLMQPGIS
jgi:hypothetical protein